MTSTIPRPVLLNRTIKFISSIRLNHGTPAGSPTVKSTGPSVPDVQGVTNKVVDVPSAALGPGASKSGNYKNPEYFAYHQWSFYEANVEMDKFRLPQPSAVKQD